MQTKPVNLAMIEFNTSTSNIFRMGEYIANLNSKYASHEFKTAKKIHLEKKFIQTNFIF